MGEEIRWILLLVGGLAIFGYYVWNTWIKRERTQRDPEFDDIDLTVSPDDPPAHEMMDELSGLSQLVAEDAPAKERLAAEREVQEGRKLSIGGKTPQSEDSEADTESPPDARSETASEPEASKPAYKPVKLVDDPRREGERAAAPTAPEPEPDVEPTDEPEAPQPPPPEDAAPLVDVAETPQEVAVEKASVAVETDAPPDEPVAEDPPVQSAASQADLFEDQGPISQPVDGLYEWNGQEDDESLDDLKITAPTRAADDDAGAEGQTQPTEEQADDFFAMDEPDFAADPKPIVGGKKRNWKFWRKDEKKSSAEPEPERMPELILVLYVVAKPATVFVGDAISEALDGAGMELGAMNIFHRIPHGGDPDKPVYSVADMLEPGTLEAERLKDHTTPGLTFFMRLPGPIDGQSAFEDMVRAAEQVAGYLGGEMRDERRSVLTRQTIDHMRERIMEYRRQTQLAISKSR